MIETFMTAAALLIWFGLICLIEYALKIMGAPPYIQKQHGIICVTAFILTPVSLGIIYHSFNLIGRIIHKIKNKDKQDEAEV